MLSATDVDATLTELLENAGFTGEFLDNSRKIFEETLFTRIAEIREDLEARFELQREELVRAIGVFLERELEESVDDIRKLCLLAVSEIGGPEAVGAFIKKVAALARAGALSASSSEWAQGSPDDSASNKDSIRGGGVAVRKEDVAEEEALTEHYVDAISRTVRRG